MPSTRHISRVDLTVTDAPWAFASERRDEIAAHWLRRSRENAAFFNGRIHLAEEIDVRDGELTGRLLKTDFKSYLYWRETGFSDAHMRDAFGSALLRSAEGYVLLGRQREGNINSGLAYLPGGFIDERDVGANGKVEIDASIAREVTEETGLDLAAATRAPGYWLTEAGPLVSVAVEYRFPTSAEDLAAGIERHLAADPNSELSAVVVVRRAADLEESNVPEYARRLVTHVLKET